jgi:hypothetical protein
MRGHMRLMGGVSVGFLGKWFTGSFAVGLDGGADV